MTRSSPTVCVRAVVGGAPPRVNVASGVYDKPSELCKVVRPKNTQFYSLLFIRIWQSIDYCHCMYAACTLTHSNKIRIKRITARDCISTATMGFLWFSMLLHFMGDANAATKRLHPMPTTKRKVSNFMQLMCSRMRLMWTTCHDWIYSRWAHVQSVSLISLDILLSLYRNGERRNGVALIAVGGRHNSLGERCRSTKNLIHFLVELESLSNRTKSPFSFNDHVLNDE